MFGALLGAVGSIGSAIFGSRKQKTENTVDYVKMAANAQAAGFNPLTALRNGGAAGFSSSTTSGGPALSGVFDSFGQIGNALERKFDPIEQKRNRVENALLDYQLKAIESERNPTIRFGGLGVAEAPQMVVQHQPPVSTVPVRAPATRRAPTIDATALPAISIAGPWNGSAKPETQLESGMAPSVSSPGLEDRFGWHVDPTVPDAPTWGNRYGEWGENVGSVATAVADFNYNMALREARNRPKIRDYNSRADPDTSAQAAREAAAGRLRGRMRAGPLVSSSW